MTFPKDFETMSLHAQDNVPHDMSCSDLGLAAEGNQNLCDGIDGAKNALPDSVTNRDALVQEGSGNFHFVHQNDDGQVLSSPHLSRSVLTLPDPAP